jgi:hypothetical protein
MNEGTDTKPLDPHGIGGDSTDSAPGEGRDRYNGTDDEIGEAV